jgi:hypothetical protein
MTQDWLAGWAEDAEAPALIDTTVAHESRIYDYWLGGKDNFAVDREAADPPRPVPAALPRLRRRAGLRR